MVGRHGSPFLRLPGWVAAVAVLAAFLASAGPAAAQTSLGGYVYTTPGIAGSGAAHYAYASILNPSGSGKTVVIQRVEIRVDSTGAATAINFNLTRINASSGGTAVTASQIPKKITTTPGPVATINHTGPSVTISAGPGNNSRIAAVLSPSRAKDVTGYKDLRFESDESLVLQPGEGMALLQEAAGSTNFVVRLMAEWTEEATVPTARNEYALATPLVAGTATVNYAYASLFNPSGSGKTLIVKRMDFRVSSSSTPLQTVLAMNVSRINASSGGSLIANWTIPRKNTNSPVSVAEVRHTGPSVTLANGPGNACT